MAKSNKLSLVAQFDDLCRLINKYLSTQEDDLDQYTALFEAHSKQWQSREGISKREREELQNNVTVLQKQVKKLNRELIEARMAVLRESEEKKSIAKEKKALLEQIRMVRDLVENPENFKGFDNREKVMSCLDTNRLPTIHSDDSSDGASGIDYDRTEDDIDLDSESNQLQTDSNEIDTDDGNIEFVRQQLKKHEEKQREIEEKLTSAISTPSIEQLKRQSRRLSKTLTLTANNKSSSSLARNGSIKKTPSSILKPHNFVNKKVFRPDVCGPCSGKIPFYGNCAKCENCGAVCHPECKGKCPLPCVKITAPTAGKSRSKKILISDFVNSDLNPQVPAVIIHCCNEIERADNILIEGLYRVVVKTLEAEQLLNNILKSKTGMPNLSRENVHLLCSVVKKFLQNLDESLITTTLWSHFSEAAKNGSDKYERSSHIEFYILNDLPTANRDTLAFMMQHLHAIAKHSAQNKMSTKFLGRSLAPTIVGNSCRNPSPALIQAENSTQTSIMETLFDIDEKFWSNFVDRTPSNNSLGTRLLNNSPPPSSTRRTTRAASRFETLPTPKLKPLFS